MACKESQIACQEVGKALNLTRGHGLCSVGHNPVKSSGRSGIRFACAAVPRCAGLRGGRRPCALSGGQPMVTMRDVAHRAGVSIATVSFVLNDTKPVTAAT